MINKYFPSIVVLLAAGWAAISLIASTSINASPTQNQTKHTQKTNSDTDHIYTRTTDKNSKIELLSAGQQPRQILYFHPKVNSKQVSLMTVKLHVTGASDGKAAPINNAPETVIRVETIITMIDPNGDIHYQMKSTAVPGKKNSASNDTDEITRGVLSQRSESIHRALTWFPKSPVGNGAIWRITSDDREDGVSIKKTTTYELSELHGNIATLHIRSEGKAPKQEIESVGINSNGIRMPRRSLFIKEAGQYTVSFDKLLPNSGAWRSESGSKMEFDNPNNNQVVNIDLATKLDMSIKSN